MEIRDKEDEDFKVIMMYKQAIDQNKNLVYETEKVIREMEPLFNRIDEMLSKHYCSVSILLMSTIERYEKNKYAEIDRLPCKQGQAEQQRLTEYRASIQKFLSDIRVVLEDALSVMVKVLPDIDGTTYPNDNTLDTLSPVNRILGEL